MKKYTIITKLFFGVAVFGVLISTTSCKEEEKTTVAPAPASQESSKDQSATKTVKVNPAHGLPGHTCALPVGAPLTSDIKLQTQTKQSTTISPLRIDQTPKVNPPHGEPGHTCSLPVGAPLP